MANVDDDSDEARDIMPDAADTARRNSPPHVGVRQRGLARSATVAESTPRFARRSSSFMSESLSESRRSFQASTDDLLRPRAEVDHERSAESSNWHSLPLLFALLPALGGLFFENGSSFITDVTLLGLGALFLNWAIRLPWDWYSSAQALVVESELAMPQQSAIEEENDLLLGSEDGTAAPPKANGRASSSVHEADSSKAARRELRVYEILALLTCFVAPFGASWLLHAIRSQLSRPSEGLVSDFNITIFLLGAEVRPLMHLIKLVQRRTIFLQRTITSASLGNKTNGSDARVQELEKRLEELEAHVSADVAAKLKTEDDKVNRSQEAATQASLQAIAELRKTLLPEIDALNRAMRRYEKRTTISAIQIEARMQDQEARLNDAIALAASAHRSVNTTSGSYTRILLNWASATVVVPVQYVMFFASIPGLMLSMASGYAKRMLGFPVKPKERTTLTRLNAPRQRSKEKRLKS